MDDREDDGSSKSLLRTLYLVVLIQFIVIAVLWSAISNEYSNSTGMRLWVAQNAAFLGLLLDGNLGSILVGLSAGFSALYLRGVVSAHLGKHETVASEEEQDASSETLAHKIREVLLLEEE